MGMICDASILDAVSRGLITPDTAKKYSGFGLCYKAVNL